MAGDSARKGFRAVVVTLPVLNTWGQILGPNSRRCGLVIWGGSGGSTSWSFDGQQAPGSTSQFLQPFAITPLVLPAEMVEGIMTGDIFAKSTINGAVISLLEFFYL